MMRAATEPSRDGRSVTVHVPLAFKRRGGRKQVVTPGGGKADLASRPARVDSTLVKALARAHRWQKMLEEGGYASVAELSVAERINPSYLARILRLTLLSPDIVERILDGRHDPERLTLDKLTKPFSEAWEMQWVAFKLVISTQRVEVHRSSGCPERQPEQPFLKGRSAFLVAADDWCGRLSTWQSYRLSFLDQSERTGA